MLKKTHPLSGENEILDFLEARYPAARATVKKGIGDDAAVLDPKKTEEFWLVTTDMLLEDIDFKCGWTTPDRLGRKSISVNLSDIAAMGARPRFYTVSLGLPREVSGKWIQQFYRGLTDQGERYGAALVGGDLSRSTSGILISVTLVGESTGRRVLYRSGGRAGDLLYVTGTLGRSAAGLRLLERGCLHPRSHPQREAVRSHLEPEPRCDAGVWLARSGMVRCMMDLSDGLSVDLPRLCRASRVGAEIDASGLPLFREASAWGMDPLELALDGGEDYELLFAVPGSRAPAFEKAYPKNLPPVTRIGRLVHATGGGRNAWIRRPGEKLRRLPEKGYDHFRGDDRRRPKS